MKYYTLQNDQESLAIGHARTLTAPKSAMRDTQPSA